MHIQTVLGPIDPGSLGRTLMHETRNRRDAWLAVRIERKLGDSSAVTNFANQLRRRFSGSKEYQDMQKGRFE